MSEASELANMVFLKIKNNPPSARDQAEMLVKSMKAYMEKDIQMEVKKVNEKFYKITGQKEDENVEVSTVVGRFGEVILYEGVNAYFERPDIRERYGAYVIDGVAEVMIPADANKAEQTRGAIKNDLSSMKYKIQQEAFRQWRNLLPKSKSMADFMMKNAFPMEAKSKIHSYVFLSDRAGGKSIEAFKPSDAKRLSAKNPHFKSIAKSKGTTLVAGVWVDTIWEDLGYELVKPVEEGFHKLKKSLEKQEKKISKKKGVAVKYDLTLPSGQGKEHGTGRLFKLVTLRLNAFVPMVAKDSDLIKIVEEKYINRSDMGALEASSKLTTDLLLAMLRKYRNKK